MWIKPGLWFQAHSLSLFSGHLLLFIHLILQDREASWGWGKGKHVIANWIDHG
jgi:hypothetical protein